MQKTKFYTTLLGLLMLIGIFSFSTGFSLLTNKVTIGSTGRISLPSITAKSGYWQDVQNAVDWIVAHGGIGTVYIPEGTWNFVNPGEEWVDAKVVIPEGVNIFGASTQRTSGLPYDGVGMNPNDQVVEWRTVLVMPYDPCPGTGIRDEERTFFFAVEGTGNPNKSTRISDIKFVGYREINHTNDRWHGGIFTENVANLRIDHCFFKHCTGGAVFMYGPAVDGYCQAVIDHCKLVNDYGYVVWYSSDCTVSYGIYMARIGTTEWEDDITKVLGHYLSYTVFIEDCYFSRWRHCVCSNDGGHYVFRHNTIEHDSVVGSLDGHGTLNYVGTRAMEIYNNTIIDPIDNFEPENWNSTEPAEWGYGVNWRGGGGVFFNNYIRNYKTGIIMVREGSVQKCWPRNIWIWNNTWVNVQTQIDPGDCQQNVDYFLYAPSWYTPYPYPHPLTLSTT